MRGTLKAQEKILLTRELSVLLKSGVPIFEALSALMKQKKFSRVKPIAVSLRDDIENGKSLSFGFARFPKTFDSFFVNLVSVGERTGTLARNLEFLAEQLDRHYALKRKIQNITLYPMIVLGAALFVGIFVSIFVLPKLVRLFSSFDIDLPLATRLLISWAGFMKVYGWWVIGGIIIFLVLFRILLLSKHAKYVWDYGVLRIPVIGSFLRETLLSLFFRDLGVMLGSGVTLSRALEVEEQMFRNQVFVRMVREFRLAVDEGKKLSQKMGDFESIFPPMMLEMVSVAERSGKLGETFSYLGDFLDKEVQRNAKNFTVLLEPILLFGIAIVVAFIALAILSPIYSLTGSLRR